MGVRPGDHRREPGRRWVAYGAGTSGRAVTYTGRELDGESGLYYYRARYYDPQTGRFLSEDPIGFDAGDQNLYRYVANNPITFVDPDGEILIAPIIAGALIGAGFEAGTQLLSGQVSSCGFDFGAIGRSALVGAASGGVIGNIARFGKVGRAIGRAVQRLGDIRFPGGIRIGVGSVKKSDVKTSTNLLGLRKFPGTVPRKSIRLGFPGKGNKVDLVDLGPRVP